MLVPVSIQQLDEGSDEDGKDEFPVELVLLLVCHFSEQIVKSLIVEKRS